MAKSYADVCKAALLKDLATIKEPLPQKAEKVVPKPQVKPIDNYISWTFEIKADSHIYIAQASRIGDRLTRLLNDGGVDCLYIPKEKRATVKVFGFPKYSMESLRPYKEDLESLSVHATTRSSFYPIREPLSYTKSNFF